MMFNFLRVFCCIFDFCSVTQLSIVTHRDTQKQYWKVISMGIRSRLGVEGRIPSGVVASLGASIRRAAEISLATSREKMPIDMLASNWLPYQASKTYSTIITESNCKRAHIGVEVQRSLCRI